MRAFLAFAWASAVLLGLTLPGCHDRDEDRKVVYEERPGPGYVIVPQPPPRILVERRPAPPGPAYIWVEGYWHWNGKKYVWSRGRWVRPPRGREVWAPPRYERYEHGHIYRRGYWTAPQPERRQYERDRSRDRERDRDRDRD